jgi:hypothetical protein
MGKGRQGYMTYGPVVLKGRLANTIGFALNCRSYSPKSPSRIRQTCAEAEFETRLAEKKQRRAFRKMLKEMALEEEKEAEEQREGIGEGYWCGCPEIWTWNSLRGRLEERGGWGVRMSKWKGPGGGRGECS